MDASDWDERYAGADLVWSSGPNVWVRELCSPLTPGRALDVAAGEGRNAIWLVEQGWTVTASDFSPVAVSRIRDLAAARLDEDALHRLEAVVADATQPAPGTAYDLVLFCYLHLVREEWDRAVAAGVEAVAVGGRVLVVGHARRNLTEGVGGPQDATILLDPGDVLASVAGLPVVVELAELRARDVEGEPRPALDTVVLLRRTADAPAR
ncbi:MAG TPA: methyltransferase domain-containing protein [Ornithinibacter sp.]|nr:methyltransferase domain-containing protein [Ornithinibacter sp.]